MPKDAKISELTLSRTQIHDYLGCGQKWQYVYKDGIIPSGIREALDRGSCVHLCVKETILTYANSLLTKGAKWSKEWEFKAMMRAARRWGIEEAKKRGDYLTPEQETQIKEIKVESIGIAQKAFEGIDLPSWEIASWMGKPFCEVEVVTPLPPWKGFRTIPDLVARKKGDRHGYWLIDWKVRGSFEEDDAEEINLQFSTMQYVLEMQTDLLIEGSLLWQIRDTPPKQPKLNQNGTMSRADIASDWETYARALRDNNLDPADYEDMRLKLEPKLWFKTLKQHRESAECAAVWRNIVIPVAKVLASKNPLIVRRWLHQPFACKGCWAREYCIADLYGGDTEFLLQTSYIDTRDPRPRLEMGEAVRKFELKEN